MIVEVGTGRAVAKILRSDDVSIYAKLNNVKEKWHDYGRVSFNKKLKIFSGTATNEMYFAKCEKI